MRFEAFFKIYNICMHTYAPLEVLYSSSSFLLTRLTFSHFVVVFLGGFPRLFRTLDSDFNTGRISKSADFCVILQHFSEFLKIILNHFENLAYFGGNLTKFCWKSADVEKSGFKSREKEETSRLTAF